MEKNKQAPPVPPKHVRRAEFYKRLRESSKGDNNQNQEKTILEQFEGITELSQTLKEKVTTIESPNSKEYEEKEMEIELKTKRKPFAIDKEQFYR